MNTPDLTPLRVLALEDSALDAELILHELKRANLPFEALRVQTRVDFERALQEFGPSIVLADYKLPNFDGGQALAIVKAHWPDLPVIVVSGAVGEETAVELLKNGATDFVLKDRLPRLAPAIRRAMREVEQRQARRAAEADLRALNERLERLVLERTQELHAKNALIEEDLAMARELQIAILPHRFPTLPRGVAEANSALKFCRMFRPSSFVSGDFFNVVRISDTAVGILICDVMGHGVRSAIVAAMIRALEEQLGEQAENPGELLTQINEAMCAILTQAGSTIFATAFFLLIDIATAQITFSNAGHPSPLLVQHGPNRVIPVSTKNTTGPALGIFEDAKFHTFDRSIQAGNLVLLFTDGLFEVENSAGEIFTEERLRELILTHADRPAHELMEEVFSEIERFADAKAFTDDVCLVGMEIIHLNTLIPEHAPQTASLTKM